MKKKLVAGMMSAMMVASLLTGCGSSDSGSAGSTATDSSTSTETGSEAAAGEADSGVTKTAYGEYTEENPYQLTFAYLEFYTQDEATRNPRPPGGWPACTAFMITWSIRSIS